MDSKFLRANLRIANLPNGRPLVYLASRKKIDDTLLMPPQARDRGIADVDWQRLPPIAPAAS